MSWDEILAAELDEREDCKHGVPIGVDCESCWAESHRTIPREHRDKRPERHCINGHSMRGRFGFVNEHCPTCGSDYDNEPRTLGSSEVKMSSRANWYAKPGALDHCPRCGRRDGEPIGESRYDCMKCGETSR